MSKVAYTFRKATLQDAAAIVRITNDAFMADAFFKKPEFVTRFNEAGVTNMISNPDECGVFLLAEDGGSNVIGSIHVEPYIKRFSSDYSSPEVVGGFSAVSVPDMYGKKGIGSFLVTAAETYLLDKVLEDSNDKTLTSDVIMEMGVVNVREDLFPWYQKQGYEICRQEKEADPSFDQIVKDGMDVYCIKMQKKIATCSK